MFIKIREGFILNKVMSLHDAVAKYVENGDTLAIGGFTTNRKPYAAVSEILRQGQKDFIVYAGPGGGEVDMLIGEGRVAAYINCYTANSGYTNVSRRFRAAIEQGKLTYEDYSQDVLMLMLHASSLGLPFLPVRLMQGSGLMKFWGISEEKRKTMPKIEDLKCAEIENPMVPGQKVVAVPVPKIDTAIIHVQQASPDGTCIIMGDEFHDIDIAIAARKTIVTCEEIVSDEYIRRDPTKTRIFGECVQAVVKAPYGAWPSQCYAYYDDDDAGLKEYLDRTTFINKDGEVCEFTDLQKHDLNLVLQKRYALLNWQQGSGKTAAVYHRAKYLLKFRKAKNVIILAPAIATNMTWIPFLTINKERFRTIQTAGDLNNIPEGTFLVVSTSMLRKLKRGLMRFVKRTSGKLCLVFDESDEITNPTSQRTRNILCIFRRLRYKILDTGTTTRNNIAELYSQFELLYNNSVNMICWSPQVYHENRDHEIEEENNPDYGTPFPAFRGHVLFRACHCPGKATVFGIEKQNQDVYNKDELSELIGKTVITRKFRDFAGEKYRIRTHTVRPSEGEHEVYRVIIEEFCRICELYYNSTGDTKKDAGLRLMRQIKLLIKACSVPHLIEGYYGDSYPSKTRYIERLIRTIPGKVAIGCTTLAAFDLYESYIREHFPDRPVFVVKGDVAFKKRQSIVTEFDSTINGILICTQQSLSSSVNIPTCNDVILESLQWNIPRMEQFYFRFIRLDSKEMKDVHYVTYEDSVEQNLMALVLTKERLNEFIKTGEVKEQSEIFEEFDITMSVIDSLLIRTQDSEGKIHISWGSQRITE